MPPSLLLDLCSVPPHFTTSSLKLICHDRPPSRSESWASDRNSASDPNPDPNWGNSCESFSASHQSRKIRTFLTLPWHNAGPSVSMVTGHPGLLLIPITLTWIGNQPMESAKTMSTWFSEISLILLQVDHWGENQAQSFQGEGRCKNESTHLHRKSCSDGKAKTCGFTVLWVSIAHEVEMEGKDLLILRIIPWIEEYNREFNP